MEPNRVSMQPNESEPKWYIDMLEKIPKSGNNKEGITIAAQQLKLKDKKDTNSSSYEHDNAYNESKNDEWEPPKEEKETQ